jgi:hypothetical protein
MKAPLLVPGIAETDGDPMDTKESFSDSIYEEQVHLAERELSSFITAVTKLYGPEQAELSAGDWLDESEIMDSPPRSEVRNWRAVTIAASVRLANRSNPGPHDRSFAEVVA